MIVGLPRRSSPRKTHNPGNAAPGEPAKRDKCGCFARAAGGCPQMTHDPAASGAMTANSGLTPALRHLGGGADGQRIGLVVKVDDHFVAVGDLAGQQTAGQLVTDR
jgi:hypothetical protein